MREKILSEIRRIAEENEGQPPGRSLFETETGIGQGAWRGRFWSKWSDAVVEAGFVPNAVKARFDPDFLFSKLAQACRHYGKIPSDAEIRLFRNTDLDFPSHSTYWNAYKSKAMMLDAFRSWLLNKEEFSDIVSMFSTSAPEAEYGSATEGFVYLIQSGGYYKIGRSEDIERRIKEIRISLPDTAKVIHYIKTDDTPGIEAYWHRRFADRRANGEWFKLSSSDVAAFKKRKYQ